MRKNFKKEMMSGLLTATLIANLLIGASATGIVVNASGNDSYVNLGIGSVSNPDNCSNATTAWSGDYIYFGKYYQQQETTSDKQPIKWRVLDTTGSGGNSSEAGAMLLSSEQVLDQIAFNEDDTSDIATVWKDSNLAKWLNSSVATIYNSEKSGDYTAGGFLNTAFNTTEQAAIMTSDGVEADKISSIISF